VPKLCDGAPDADCACIKVTPDGDDASAIASHGAKPFGDVQLALDFASEHPEVASKVCVVGGADCTLPQWPARWSAVYPGPESGDFTMHDGVSLYGSYESTNFTRCTWQSTALSLMSPAGVVFPSSVVHPTTIDGFLVLHFEADASTGVSVRGAKGAVVSAIRIEDGNTAVDLYGVDVGGGAQATLRNVTVAMPMPGSGDPTDTLPTGEVYGIRATGSEVTVDGCTLNLDVNGERAYGVWLENAPGAAVQNSTLTLDHQNGDLTGIHVQGAGASLTGNTLQITPEIGGLGIVGAEFIDAPDVVFSASGYISGEGLHALRSKVDATIDFTLRNGDPTIGTTAGVVLDTSPGAALRGTVEDMSQLTTVVLVTGDATGTVIQNLTAKVHSAQTGIQFSDCGGATPLVTGCSLRPQNTLTYTSEAISSFGDCRPRIENNPLIVGAGWGELSGVHCGNGSLCSISNNADIHVEIVGTPVNLYPFTLTGIRCDPGSCGDIVGNHASGFSTYYEGIRLYGSHGYGIVSGGGLVAKNVVRAGCAFDGAGILAAGGLIENNFAYGPGCDTLAPVDTAGAALDITGSPVVESNTLFGSAARSINGGSVNCQSIAGVRLRSGDAIVRNNIISGGRSYGNCTGADFVGSLVSVFQNNDLLGPTYLVGGTLHMDIDEINALGPGYAANFSAGCFAPDNVHLAANSACIDAGTPEGAPPDDFEGDPRDDHPDVGADEWKGSVPPNPCIGACSGHGSCQVSNGAAVCTCYSGYLAPDCSAVDLCAINNGGCDQLTTCTGFPGGRTCGACPPDYSGSGETGCTPVSCAANPCQNGGTCTPTAGGGHSCACPPQVTGTNCETTFNLAEAGDDFTCVLRSDGQIVCFGRDDRGQTDVPAGTYTSLSAGHNDACAVHTDGTLACWGYSNQGVTSPPAGVFQSVSVGDNYACALNGDVPTCWGALPAPPSGGFHSIAVGDWHACGLRSDWTIACWGASGIVPDYGQMSPPPGMFNLLSLDGTTSCAIGGTLDYIQCWGAPLAGMSPPSGGFGTLSLGSSTACALGINDGVVHCWGGDAGILNVPASAFDRQLTVGSHHACAMRGPIIQCWGDNTYGQLTPPY
jgi:hypothetical protein